MITFMYPCMLLILILNQEVMSNPVDFNTGNQSNINPENQRLHTSKAMRTTFNCLAKHYRRILRLEVLERFGNTSHTDLYNCLRDNIRGIQMGDKFDPSFGKCYEAQYRVFEKISFPVEVEPSCVDMTNTQCPKLKSLMLTSRDSMDLCMKNSYDGLRDEVMDVVQSIAPCISQTPTFEKIPAEEIAKIRESPEFLHYCAIN